MNLKIDSRHLIYIILAQIVIIDILIAGFLLKSIHNTNNNTVKPEKALTAAAKTEVPGKKALPVITIPEDGLFKDAMKSFNRPKSSSGRDFKIPDYTVEEGNFIATAYDLSYKSCGKYPSDPEYGITFSGTKAVKGRTIAVDPAVIPLGSSVFLEFQDIYSNLDGWYTAEDTGSKVKGNIIDVFLGESAFKEMEKFGSRRVRAKIQYSFDTGGR